MKKLVRGVIILILIFSIVALGKDVFNQVDGLKDIQDVESESKKLEEENQQLKQTAEEKGSKFSLEKEARDKLSYKKDGEVVYVVDIQSKQEAETSQQSANWKQWLELFFK